MSARSHWSYAVRTLSKSPGFALAVVLSLALGIGANAAIFSIVNGLLLHPAGISNAQRLVAPRVNYKKLNLDKIAMSATDFADVRDLRRIFSKTALLDTRGFNYSGEDVPQRLEGALVTAEWFQVLGRAPILGRDFRSEEDEPGANHVAILSFHTWQQLFGGDHNVIGRKVLLDNTPYRIVGVMPADLRWPLEIDIWTAIGLPRAAYTAANRFNETYLVIARLAPGVSQQQAASAIEALSHRVLDQVPYAKASGWSLAVEPLTDLSAGNLKTPMLLLLAAVAFVLLLACANIAGLLLVRGTARLREFAVRTALGASRSDLLAQSLAETLMLSAAGTALGFALAFGILQGLLTLARAQLSTDLFINIDRHVLLFTASAGLVSTIVFGLLPAWQIARLGSQYGHLKTGGRSETESQQQQRLRSVLVAGQIAIALVLLVGAGLLVRTLTHLQSVNPGFDVHVATASVSLSIPAYDSEAKQAAFYRAVLSRLREMPGVKSAAAANIVPFAGGDPSRSFEIEGQTLLPGDPGPHGSYRAVTPGYFQTLRVPLLAGRDFTDADRQGSRPVAIIDVNLARRYWPSGNALGARIRGAGSKDPWATIVGIVGHVKQDSLAADEGRGAQYLPLDQQPFEQAIFAVRGFLPPAQLKRDIQTCVESADPAEAIFDAKTLEERVALALGPQQLACRILSAFAAAALALSIIGLYGVVSYNVARRSREIGIRTALGAERSRILGLVIGQAMRLVIAGLLAGLFAAALLDQFAASQVFETRFLDPPTLGVTALILMAAALIASLVPAWRASRVDPVSALRNE